MQTSDELTKGAINVKAPRKWTPSWSGPHKISGLIPDETGHRYVFYHKERGVEIRTHVNKLCRFQPWSEGITSTSSAIDANRLFKCGEWVTNGALVVVPLAEPYPFGIARVISSTDKGKLQLQWLGNRDNKVQGPYEAGWNASNGSKYYAAEPRHKSHKPYTTAQDKVVLNQRDVIMHGFQLTKSNALPAPLLRAIARNPLVWWDPTAPSRTT